MPPQLLDAWHTLSPMRYGPHVLGDVLSHTGLLRMASIAFVSLLMFAGSAGADEHPTYQSLFDQIARSPDCASQDDVDLLVVTCDKTQDTWYFTKSGHPAHPGVVRRYIVESAQGVSVAEHGWSFAPDAAQPAFKTFLAQIQALDDQMRVAIAAQHGGPPILPPGIRIYGNWQPQGTENEAVVSLTNYYFRLEDAGQYEQAYALLDAPLAQMLPFSEYGALNDRSVAGLGRVKSRTIVSIDWEKDTPQGPPGTYAALDYVAETERGQLCGYVAWKRAPDGFFVLVREETNQIPAALSDGEKAALKAKFHCAG